MSGSDERDRLDRRSLLARYRVTSGEGFDLDRFASDDKPEGFPRKDEARSILEHGTARLAELQELLYANASWSLLVIIQAMDAAGKDSTIKHVMTGVNPQGVVVTSFKRPGPLELAHDFLWRAHNAVPARGLIGIFNRSHYEDVLVSRVHPDLLATSRLPADLIEGDHIWRQRIDDIAAFEAYLGRQGVRVLKFFLDVGLEEQKKRFLSRLDDPRKTWKFEAADVEERRHWPAYREAYQAAIAGTASAEAPWFIVPADRKWFMRLVVAEAMVAALEDLDLTSPNVSDEDRAKLDAARRHLQDG